MHQEFSGNKKSKMAALNKLHSRHMTKLSCIGHDGLSIQDKTRFKIVTQQTKNALTLKA